MNDNPKAHYDAHFQKLVDEVAVLDIADPATTTAMKNFQIFSNIRVPDAVAPKPAPEPTKLWGRFKRGAGQVLDNETTRVFIKSLGAFAGVATVAYATIHKDHVLERQAFGQAQQTRVS